ncbi:hypothetical protein BKA69DRAFT_1038126 [Paraphysoderma sedebokerense]|nr:hypothetical protein BKA69DRAFT_1038126 [Paraphysoderma sedebokerense]
MKSITYVFAASAALVILSETVRAQSPLWKEGMLSWDCTVQLAKTSANALDPCGKWITEVDPWKVFMTSDGKTDFILSSTKTICSDQCFEAAKTSKAEIESKCPASNFVDEKIRFGASSALILRDAVCVKDANELCAVKLANKAKELGITEKIFSMVVPTIPELLLKVRNFTFPDRIPLPNEKRNAMVVGIATDIVNKIARGVGDLPNEYVCSKCIEFQGEQIYAWYNTQVSQRLEQVFTNAPELKAAVENLVDKANQKCGPEFINRNAQLTVGKSNEAQLQVTGTSSSNAANIEAMTKTLLSVVLGGAVLAF